MSRGRIKGRVRGGMTAKGRAIETNNRAPSLYDRDCERGTLAATPSGTGLIASIVGI
jgi:hypothetical protein